VEWGRRVSQLVEAYYTGALAYTYPETYYNTPKYDKPSVINYCGLREVNISS
jgi:hypothetical protein